MAYEKQREIAEEVNRVFPKEKGNLSQQTARMAYNAYRLNGGTPEDAERRTVELVRQTNPSFRR